MFVCLHTCLSSIIRYYVSRPLSISLFPSLSLCVCVSVCLCIRLPVYLYVGLFLFVYYLVLSISIHQSIHPLNTVMNLFPTTSRTSKTSKKYIHPSIHPQNTVMQLFPTNSKTIRLYPPKTHSYSTSRFRHTAPL